MSHRNSNRKPRPAFTLVELLVVIAVIALLIGILVPTVTTVKNRARETATRATLTSISTGIQTFRGDSKFGGELPPSAADSRVADQTGSVSRIANPYSPQGAGGGIPGGTIDVPGASLLYFALAGADSLGTAGFKVLRSPADGNQQQTWGADQGNVAGGSPPRTAGAYAINQNTQQPYWPRGPLYVDISTINRSQFNVNARSFEVPAEIEIAGPTAQTQGGQGAPQRTAPMFLDSFGFPILYWRADSAGTVCAANSREFPGNAGLAVPPGAPPAPQSNVRGIYNWSDNGGLIGTTAATRNVSLRLSRSGKPHKLNWKGPGNFPEFWEYIRDPKVTAKAQPHNSDSYLLVTPGIDGVYGTADDIANFEHGGR